MIARQDIILALDDAVCDGVKQLFLRVVIDAEGKEFPAAVEHFTKGLAHIKRFHTAAIAATNATFIEGTKQ